MKKKIYHVLHGGSWTDVPLLVRSANRLRYTPDLRIINIGFRLMLRESKYKTKMIRGGSWGVGPGFMRSADRNRSLSPSRFNALGFRLTLRRLK